MSKLCVATRKLRLGDQDESSIRMYQGQAKFSAGASVFTVFTESLRTATAKMESRANRMNPGRLY